MFRIKHIYTLRFEFGQVKLNSKLYLINKAVYMKTIILFILSVVFSTQIKAQSAEMLDSLRYYPNVTVTKFAYQSNGNPVGGVSFYQASRNFVTLNNYVYQYLDSGISSGDAVPFGASYERVDSTNGHVYRSSESFLEFSTNYEGPLSVTTIFENNYEPQTISRQFKDSLEFPIERLFFEVQPQIGDTVLVGSARFAGSSVLEEIRIDSIAAKDIVVIYRGYREISDRDLGFDNPADTLFKLLDFEIRNAFTVDSLLTYTLAKDLGLLEIGLTSKKDRFNVFKTQKAQVFDTEVNGRTFTRLGLYVSNEKSPELPNSISIKAFPNPFNPATTIQYVLPKSGKVKINVFDNLGRIVQTLENGYKTFGSHTVPFNANGLASGFYLVRIESQNEIQTTKVVLIK